VIVDIELERLGRRIDQLELLRAAVVNYARRPSRQGLRQFHKRLTLHPL
jgi:hypothetical protein